MQIQQFAQALGDDPALAGDDSARRIVLQQLFGETIWENTMSKEQEEHIARVEEDNKIMRGRLAAIGQPYMPGDQSPTPLDGRVEAIESTLAEQSPVLSSIKGILEALTVQADQDPEPVHPIGLCQDESCETCVAQGIALVEAGKQSLADEINSALLLAGGEPLRARIDQLVQQGQALRNHRAQVVEVVN